MSNLVWFRGSQHPEDEGQLVHEVLGQATTVGAHIEARGG